MDVYFWLAERQRMEAAPSVEQNNVGPSISGDFLAEVKDWMFHNLLNWMWTKLGLFWGKEILNGFSPSLVWLLALSFSLP